MKTAKLEELKNKYPYTFKIFKKMCDIVGADVEDIDFSQEGWQKQYNRTLDTETAFGNRLIDFLYDNKEASKELFGKYIKNKDFIRRKVQRFILDYGRTIPDESFIGN